MKLKRLEVQGVFLCLKKPKNDFNFKLINISLQREKNNVFRLLKYLNNKHIGNVKSYR